jgi:signal transduction histidine kinase
MNPLLSEDRDGATLQNLGRASLQIVHDIKNQLNGLKLYATYLRKRIEKIDEAADLQETVAKLIAGLDRSANDMNVLVQYGRPLSLNKQAAVDINKLMRGISANWPEAAPGDSASMLLIDSDSLSLIGEYDATALTDAFKAISLGAAKSCPPGEEGVRVSLRREIQDRKPTVVIEWGPVEFPNEDPFRSFKGSEAIRMSLAAKIVEAHGGSAEHETQRLRVRLPLVS